MYEGKSLKYQVNSSIRTGDKRSRADRYNGGSTLGYAASGGAAATDEYRERFDLMKCERHGEGVCSLPFGHRGACEGEESAGG